MAVLNYIVDNYIMIFELIGLIIMLKISAHISARMRKTTLAVIILLLITSVIIRIEAWTGTFETLNIIRPILTAMIYSIYPIILVLVMQIIGKDNFSTKKLLLLLSPAIICVPVYFTSQWTHIVCWFGDANNYVAGPLHRLPYIIFGMYMLVFLVHNFLHFKKYSSLNRIIPGYIIIFSIAGVVLYVMLNITSDYSALFSSSLLLYYLYIYIHMAKIDPLTTLFNRQSYYRDIELRGDKISGVASIDMNDLKYINDNLGHGAGDEALKTISKTLSDNCGRGGTIYRVGGDEFIVLYENSGEEAIGESIDAMRRKMAETKYVCAFGYAMKGKGETIADAVREADKRMYEDKAELKKNKQGENPNTAR